MAVETSYSSFRENLASVLDRVVDNREVLSCVARAEKTWHWLLPTNSPA